MTDFTPVSIGEILQEPINSESKTIFENLSGLTKRDAALALANLSYGSAVKVIDNISQMPPVVNGFRQLEQKGYIFTEQITLDEFPILIPAGYNGFIMSTMPPTNGINATNMGGKSLFNTLNLEGIITSIADAGGGKIEVTTSGPHGLLDGQFVNIQDTGDITYDLSRFLVSNVTTNTFEVVTPFTSNLPGTFNTGFNALGFDFIGLFADGGPKLLDVTASKLVTTLFSYDSIFAQGFTTLGTVRKSNFVVGSRGQFLPLDAGFTFEDCVTTTLTETVIAALLTFLSNNSMLNFTGSLTKDVLISNCKLKPAAPDQFPIKLDSSIIDAALVIVNTPDNGVTVDYFDPSGLDQTNPLVVAANNGARPNSMVSAQVGFTNIATPIVVPIATQDVPVIIGGTQFLSANLERATATNSGQITNLAKATKKYAITFSALVEKVGGGSTDIGLLLIKNGVLDLTSTFEIPHSVNTGVIQISATRDFELAENDTIDIAVVNFDGTSSINVSQANISYSLGA